MYLLIFVLYYWSFCVFRKSNGQAEKPSKKSDGHTEKRGRKPKTIIEPIIVAANSDFQDDEDFSQHMLNPGKIAC